MVTQNTRGSYGTQTETVRGWAQCERAFGKDVKNMIYQEVKQWLKQVHNEQNKEAHRKNTSWREFDMKTYGCSQECAH